MDADPDDERDDDSDSNEYDPVTENTEVEDPDDVKDVEDEIDEGVDMNEGEEEEQVETNTSYKQETKQCHLKNLNKDLFIAADEDDSTRYAKMQYKKVPDNERESDPIITYYEMVRIIGIRAQQFNLGAEPLIKGVDGLSSSKIAYLELMAKQTPFIIRRHLPGKRYEEWLIKELDNIHKITDDFYVPDNFDINTIINKKNT